MIKNYFKVAWRNLFKNKGFSLTNIAGLTIGMTCTLLIFLWVQDELNYNRFHKHYEDIYQVMANRDFNNQKFTDQNMVLPLAAGIRDEIPEVEKAVVITYPIPTVLSVGDSRIKKEGYQVSDQFFDLFSWSFVMGNARTAITDQSSIVLSESTARAIFGDQDPIGKMVRLDNKRDARVSAVVKDAPENSSLRFDYVVPFNYSEESTRRAMENWRNSSWSVFIQPKDGAHIDQLEKKITAVKVAHDPSDLKISSYFLFAMKKWRLYSDFRDGKNVGGMISYVRLFSIIGAIILLIACVNFMNLSTARSEKRAKEVGIRKTLGSDKRSLVFQFLMESMILAFLAFLFCLFAVYILLPAFNQLVDKKLELPFANIKFWLASFAVILCTGFLAGSYPALYLSSFNPTRVLKSTGSAGKRSVLPRHVLVVAQFVISIFLISATIIIYRQIQHVKSRDIGYRPDNLVMIPSTDATQQNFDVIKNELLKTGLVDAVTRTSSPMTAIWWKSPAPDWDGKPANADIIFSGMTADVDFTRTMGIKMLEGKDFSGTPADSASMMLNKAAVELTGIKDPVGKQMRYDNRLYTIIGVTDNVIMESPFKPVDPLMIYFDKGYVNYNNIRLRDQASLQKGLKAIENVFKKYNPAFPFEYQFADQEFAKKFITEQRVGRITNIFAALAIFICCIGLAGLAAFTVEKRFREIGIRKVLGASLQQLLYLVSREFLILVGIAFLIATPVSWWMMQNWLANYEYRTVISPLVFVMVGAVVLLLALLVVGANTLRSALASPVKSLRTE